MHVINAINNLPNNLIWNSICSYIWVQSLFCVGMMVARLPLPQNSVCKYIIEKFTITLTKICLQYKGCFLHASYSTFTLMALYHCHLLILVYKWTFLPYLEIAIYVSTDESWLKKLRFKKESRFKKDCSNNQNFSI